MTTQINNHIRESGEIPQVTFTNWNGRRATLGIETPDMRLTIYVSPVEGQSVENLISEIKLAFANAEVDFEEVN